MSRYTARGFVFFGMRIRKGIPRPEASSTCSTATVARSGAGTCVARASGRHFYDNSTTPQGTEPTASTTVPRPDPLGQKTVLQGVCQPRLVLLVGPPVRDHEAFISGVGAERHEKVGGALWRELGAQSAPFVQQSGEPGQSGMPLRILLALEPTQVGFGGGGRFEHCQQRSHAGPDARLRARVERQLPPGIGLVDDRADHRPGLYRSLGPLDT